MKQFVSAAALAALALGATAANARTTKTCPAVTQAQVEGQFQRFMDAWASGNPRAVTALFAPDATLLATVSNAERTGPEKINDYFVSFLQGKPTATLDTSTVTIDCNTATRTGNWTVALNNANGERANVTARYSFVYKWDGRDWKIQHLHSSVRPPVSQ